METLLNSTSQPKGIAMSALARQIDTSSAIRIIDRFDNFTDNRCYSLVMAEYPLSFEEARRAAFDAKYAECFNMIVINYGTDYAECCDAYNYWICSK